MPERLGAADLVAWLTCFDDRIAEQAEWLTGLDSAIGDADHGTNLTRGTAALRGRLPDLAGASPGAVLRACGMTLVSTVGGASGSLYGTFFLEMATSAEGAMSVDGAISVEGEMSVDGAISVTGQDAFDRTGLLAALRAGVDGVVARGRAEPGDKTMVDALGPAIEALDAADHAGLALGAALGRAAEAAAAGRDATMPLVARKGRASYLGDRSADHLDPGAASAAILIGALAESWAEHRT